MERKKAIIVLSSATAKVDHCCERSDFYFVRAAMAPSHAMGIHESKKKPWVLCVLCGKSFCGRRNILLVGFLSFFFF